MKYNISNLPKNSNFIYFWGHHEKSNKITKACLSQWYPSKFIIDEITYNCAEQFMMAQKAKFFNDDDIYIKILQESDPSIIKKLGRKVKNFNSEQWLEKAQEVVLVGNLAKFNQNSALKEFLISTDGNILVEASPYDTIWGIGMKKEEAEKVTPKEWKGTNYLGFILTEIRDIIKNK